MPLFMPLLAEGGFIFAFEHSTLPGKTILLCLFIASIFSWSVMITKLRMVSLAKKQSGSFLDLFRGHRQTLYLY